MDTNYKGVTKQHSERQMTNQRYKELVKETCKFVKYVDEFYGTNGIYPMGATIDQICDATLELIDKLGNKVEFDSIDRERVRDILIEKFGLVFPTSTETLKTPFPKF